MFKKSVMALGVVGRQDMLKRKSRQNTTSRIDQVLPVILYNIVEGIEIIQIEERVSVFDILVPFSEKLDAEKF